MQSIASSVVIVAGCATMFGATQVRHGDAAVFLNLAGILVGIVGLWGFITAMKSSSK